ncbi:MAG TPA: tRNA lysidine(34) synthetase TilS [Bryobacterales bacterium]|nr:tRNA lysidine(34) synthetase TilS [Bryobacterales bacterium]
MESFVPRVAQTIEKYGMFRAGERVGVAVSGGPDSVALLRALCDLKGELGILPGVVHLNHGLRGAESADDAEFVAELARSLGLEFVLETVDVRALAAASGENLEQAGRRLRYEFFRRLIGEGRFQKIAVGHTRTDQAETVLFRLLRGAATAGLAGIYPVLEGTIVRPLIEVERPEVLDYLRAIGQSWREDSSNQSRELARNRLRHDLLPQLAKEWNPEITPALAQLADWARDEEAYWRVEVEQLAGRYFRRQGRVVYFEAPKVADLAPAVQRRLLRHAVELVRGDLRGIDFGHIEQIRALATMGEGHGRAQIPGVDGFRSFNQMRLAPIGTGAGLEGRNFSLCLTIPGSYDVAETQSRFLFHLSQREGGHQEYNERLAGLDWERTPRPLWLRNWRPGDRYQPVGWGGPEKLKTLFQERKVPLWERRHWPVVASEHAVVWARGFGAAAELAAGPESRTVLEITEL